MQGQEVLLWAGASVAFVVFTVIVFLSLMSKFLRRPSPSEAIIRTGREKTDVFIGRACWIVPLFHRAATISLSTIGLTIRRAAHEALVTKDFISTNLAAEFYVRIEPNDDDVKKAARTIGIDEGHASADAIRSRGQQLLEPKLVGALRAVAAQNDFLALHLDRVHFANEVSKALHEDLARNGFTLESVTITELAQTPLSEMRADDIFGASGRETVTNTVVAKNIAVRMKQQEEAERNAEIAMKQEIRVATLECQMREGKATQEQTAIKAELSKNEAIEARELQRQGFIGVELQRKEQVERVAQIQKDRALLVEENDKKIAIAQKEKEFAAAETERNLKHAELEGAKQQIITVQQVAEAERLKRVAVVDAERGLEQQKLIADADAYKKKIDADAIATAQRASAEGRADSARIDAQGAADAIKIKAKAEADAAELQALSITRLASANREAGLKEAEVLREKINSSNAKSRDILVAEVAQYLLAQAPALVRELVEPARHIGEIKVLQLSSGSGGGGGGDGTPLPLLGSTVGPVVKTILETSAVLPIVKEMLQFADAGGLRKFLMDTPEVVKAAAPPPPAPKPVRG